MPLAGQTVEPIGLNSFCGHSGVTAGVIGKKKRNYFLNIFVSTFYFIPRATSGPSGFS